MNRNSLLGLIGITLFVFVVAFAVGRWTRSVQMRSTTEFAHPGPAPESLATIEAESTRLLTAAQAYEEEVAAPPRADAPASSLVAARPSRSRALPNAPSRPETTQKSPPDTGRATPAASAAPTTDTAASLGSATESLTPKAVVAKNYVAIEERQNYAAQLPKELLTKGVAADVNVVGELAEVIILSSPAFDARSQDTLIKQVCIDLKSLGFKRVHITNGGDYTMHFGL